MFPFPVVPPVGVSLDMAGSIVFNGSDEYLRIGSFSSSSPDQKTFTISLWAKRDNTSSDEVWFDMRNGGSSRFQIFYDDVDDQLALVSYNGSTFDISYGKTNEVVDTQWQHWVYAVDTTQATEADRVKQYLDGVEIVPAGGTSDLPSQNTDLDIFNNGDSVRIGDTNSESDLKYDGRLADFIVVEGQALSPSNFGYDNSGTWSWKNYTGSYGSHGFRINPQNSGEIGDDQSGNGYDFTLNNMGSSNFDSSDKPPV